MKYILSNNFYLFFVGFLLTINDLLSFGLCKYIYLNQFNYYYLFIPSFFYAFQIPLFYYGITFSSMAVLNIIWNLMSIIFVTFLGLFYFKEKISNIKTIALALGIFSLILFGLDDYV